MFHMKSLVLEILYRNSLILCYWHISTYLVKYSKCQVLGLKYFPTHELHEILSSKPYWRYSELRVISQVVFFKKFCYNQRRWVNLYFVHFSCKGLKISIVNINTNLFPTAFQTMTVCRNILFASNARLVYLIWHNQHDYDTSIQGDNR